MLSASRTSDISVLLVALDVFSYLRPKSNVFLRTCPSCFSVAEGRALLAWDRPFDPQGSCHNGLGPKV
jgi:hypothetical protein